MNAILQPIVKAFTACIPSERSRKTSKEPQTTVSKPVWTIFSSKDSTRTSCPAPQATQSRPRTPDDPNSPRRSVFHNYELTEQILLNLSLKDLVEATAVCPRWYSMILTSKTLRTRLLEEPIPKTISNPYPEMSSCSYNMDNGNCWFFRIYPQSLYDAGAKAAVVILRTPRTHIELLVYQHEPKIVVLDPGRTRLFGIFADSVFRVDGYDDQGNLVWKDLCGVYTSASTPFCGYLWKYLISQDLAAEVKAATVAHPTCQGYFTPTTVRILCVDDRSLWKWRQYNVATS